MKKIKIFTFILLVIIVILTLLSFLKLPINILSKERFEKESNNLVSLISFEKQSLRLLPSPSIEVVNSVFFFNTNSFEAEIAIPSLELSRSLFDKKNIFLKFNKADLQNIKTPLIKNEVLLEDEIEDINISIKNIDDFTEIKTKEFQYRGADISFSAYLKDNSLEKLSFSIKKLEIDELVLLLDEKYQKYLSKINFSDLDIKGEYAKNSLFLEKFELNLKDGTKINLLGILDLENIFNSDIEISGTEVSSDNIIQFFNNLNLEYNDNTLPKGILKLFKFKYDQGLIEDSEFFYKSELGTEILINGDIESLNILNSNLSLKLNSTSSEEILKILETNLLLELPQFKFDKLKFNSIIEKGILKVSSLNLIDDDTNIEIIGEIDLDNFENRKLKINIQNFKSFNLLPSSKFKDYLIIINPESINIESILSELDLKIVELNMLLSENSALNLSGNVNLLNFEKALLNLNIEKINIGLIKKILEFINQDSYLNYLEIIDFDEIQGSIILDLSKNLIVVDKMELIKEDNITGILSGEISENQFQGLTDIKNISLSRLDQKFLKTNRIKGILNINMEIPKFISMTNLLGMNGSIDGNISVNISKDELALLMFVQSLSQDIEDFQQINELIGKLSKSFVNQNISLNGNIINNTKNKILIRDMKFTAPSGENLFGELEYYGENYKITIFDIINDEDLIIKFENGSYSYERVIPDGTIKKPIEELIQKNINKLFENLLQ